MALAGTETLRVTGSTGGKPSGEDFITTTQDIANLGGGGGVTWPATGQIVVSAGVSSQPTGTAPATGILTFLATPTSANLAAAVTNETGSGLLVFATSPTLTTPVIASLTSSLLYVDGSGIVSAVTLDSSSLRLTSGTLQSIRSDVALNFSGVPTASQKATFITGRAFTLPQNLTTPTSQATIGTNPTATLTVTLKKNGSSIGTVAYATNGTPTLTFASGVSFAVGDILTAICPASPDATGADIAINLLGTLN